MVCLLTVLCYKLCILLSHYLTKCNIVEKDLSVSASMDLKHSTDGLDGVWSL